MNEKLLTDEEIKAVLLEVADRYYDAEIHPNVSHTVLIQAQLSKAEPIIRKEVVAAVVKWGNEPCEEHAESRARRVYLKRKVIRAECPQCWASLEQEAREEKGK